MATLMAACQKNDVSTAIMPPMIDSSAVLKLSGVFMPTEGISVAGTAKIYLQSGKYKLGLDSSFAVSEGPDLKIYLAKEYPPTNYIILGPLQANSGSQRYNIPDMPDFKQYKYALVHCQQFNHLFAFAELK